MEGLNLVMQSQVRTQISGNELARVLGLKSRERLRQLKRAGFIVGERGVYELESGVQGYVAYLRDRISKARRRPAAGSLQEMLALSLPDKWSA